MNNTGVGNCIKHLRFRIIPADSLGFMGTMYLGFGFVFDREIWRFVGLCRDNRFGVLHPDHLRNFHSSQKNARCRKTLQSFWLSVFAGALHSYCHCYWCCFVVHQTQHLRLGRFDNADRNPDLLFDKTERIVFSYR